MFDFASIKKQPLKDFGTELIMDGYLNDIHHKWEDCVNDDGMLFSCDREILRRVPRGRQMQCAAWG